ncbi:chromogranin-A [Eublepharis macularius]|uniref:Chromogranin-A n=1 Tax=Eublepharis macularius TaxID=481883 RepID=A0AA97KPV0_EUBMA|nr:chromogranin-A [Eublepharis macularius]
MSPAVSWALLLLAAQAMSLPVTNPTAKDDTKVMKCIVEVISDTVSKPNPLPISQECLEILQGDERIRSILRHQNLLKELQEIAVQGANKRTEQQKKNSGFEDELSEVLESQGNKNTERDLSEEILNEEPTTSFAELGPERSQMDSERDISKEDKRDSMEERETGARETDPKERKESAARFESNEVGETDELPWEDAVDNHIRDDFGDDGIHEEGEEPAEKEEADEFAEKDPISKNRQEESNEEVEDSVQDRAEDEEEEEEQEEEEEEEEERGTSEEEHTANSDDEDDEKGDENEGTKSFEKDDKLLEEKEEYHSEKGGKRDSPQAEDPFHARDAESKEMKEEPSKDLEDAKRWNKMDELAKQLTTTKRTEENESSEDPDRSMKLAFQSHKHDFHNPEDEIRKPQEHHSKEDTSEGGFPLPAMPEEKKDEEGSANRRTEDQELESLAAIEAELEKVAQKLHALRRG